MLTLMSLPGIFAAIAILALTLHITLQIRSPVGFVAWAVHASLFCYQITFGGFLIEFWLSGVLSIVVVAGSAIMASRM